MAPNPIDWFGLGLCWRHASSDWRRRMIAERPLLPEEAVRRSLLAGASLGDELLKRFQAEGLLTEGIEVPTDAGEVRFYCVLNRDAVRLARRGDIDRARLFVESAREIEADAHARAIASDVGIQLALVAAPARHVAALWLPVLAHEVLHHEPLTTWSSLSARRMNQWSVRQRGSLPRDLRELRNRMVHQEPAHAAETLLGLTAKVSRTRAAAAWAPREDCWYALGRIREMRSTAVHIEDESGRHLALPRMPLEKLGLAQAGLALCIYYEAISDHDAVWSLEPALDFRGAGSDAPLDPTFDRFAQPDAIQLSAAGGRWLRAQLATAPEPSLVAPLTVRGDGPT